MTHMQGFLVVNCWQEVTNFLFPVRENYIVTVMQDVIITVEIRMKNRKFLTKYDYILNMHKIIKYNNKLECGPMPNMMAALPNVGGALCSTPQSLADAHYSSAVQ